MDFVTPVVEHWLEREIAQWVHPMKDRSDDPSHHERTLLPRIKDWKLCRYIVSNIHITETNKVLKEHHSLGQDNTIYTFSIDISLLSKGQNRSKLQKQRGNVLISIVTAA